VDSIKKISVCQLNKIDKCIEFVKYRKGEFDHIVKVIYITAMPAIGAFSPNSLFTNIVKLYS